MRVDSNGAVHRRLRVRDDARGADVKLVQVAINQRGSNRGFSKVTVDGVYGPETDRVGRAVAASIGVRAWFDGLGEHVQKMLRQPDQRSAREKARADRWRKQQASTRPVAPSVNGWNPLAERVPYAGGVFTVGNPKLVWHTTEGYSLPSYSGSAPHFTLDPKAGKLWQHIPVTQAAKALVHPAGTPDTNNAHAIQVELIGFAKDAATWPSSYYSNIAGLARWIETHAGVPRRSTVTFKVGAARLGASEFVTYSGHCGHEHVPHNEHWDPGAFRIGDVLK